MVAISDLIAQIRDVEFRNKIEQEVNRMNSCSFASRKRR